MSLWEECCCTAATAVLAYSRIQGTLHQTVLILQLQATFGFRSKIGSGFHLEISTVLCSRKAFRKGCKSPVPCRWRSALPPRYVKTLSVVVVLWSLRCHHCHPAGLLPLRGNVLLLIHMVGHDPFLGGTTAIIYCLFILWIYQYILFSPWQSRDILSLYFLQEENVEKQWHVMTSFYNE